MKNSKGNDTLSQSDWRLTFGTPGDVACVINDFCCDQLVNVARSEYTDEDIFKVGERNRICTLLGANKLAVIRPTAHWFSRTGIKPDPEKLFGWALYGIDRATHRPVVHFIYVKAGFRGNGLARTLAHAAGVREETPSWATHSRGRLAKVMEKYSIIPNKYLLDWNPNIPRNP